MNGIIEPLTKPVRVIHGASNGCFLLAGCTVEDVLKALGEPFGIPPDALAFLNGEPVERCHVLNGNDSLEFVLAGGVKGALDPHEQAQLDRIEALLSQLVGSQGHAAKPLAAPRGRRGRTPETLEIAEYANELRLQGESWNQVLSDCKNRWPNDRRVRNVGQIRATWNRHFGPKKSQH